jgi:hypothetical protein
MSRCLEEVNTSPQNKIPASRFSQGSPGFLFCSAPRPAGALPPRSWLQPIVKPHKADATIKYFTKSCKSTHRQRRPKGYVNITASYRATQQSTRFYDEYDGQESKEIIACLQAVPYKPIMLNSRAASAPVFLARLMDLTTLSTAKIALRQPTVKAMQ